MECMACLQIPGAQVWLLLRASWCAHITSRLSCALPPLCLTQQGCWYIDTAGHDLAPMHARTGSSSSRACGHFQFGAVRYVPT